MGRCLRCHRVPAVAAATPMAARAGSASAAGIRRTPESASVAGALLHLQRQYGNQYVGRALRQAGAGEHDGSRLGAIRREIEQTRGGKKVGFPRGDVVRPLWPAPAFRRSSAVPGLASRVGVGVPMLRAFVRATPWHRGLRAARPRSARARANPHHARPIDSQARH